MINMIGLTCLLQLAILVTLMIIGALEAPRMGLPRIVGVGVGVGADVLVMTVYVVVVWVLDLLTNKRVRFWEQEVFVILFLFLIVGFFVSPTVGSAFVSMGLALAIFAVMTVTACAICRFAGVWSKNSNDGADI